MAKKFKWEKKKEKKQKTKQEKIIRGKSVRREKIKGKYYMVYKINNKIIDKKPWSNKSIINKKTKDYKSVNKKKAFELFKERGSFSTRKTINVMTNVVEHTITIRKDYQVKDPKKATNIRNRKFWMYQVTISYGKTSVTARSDITPNQTLEEKREKAYERALGLLNNKLGLDYESSEALKLIEKQKVEVKEEVVYYGKK